MEFRLFAPHTDSVELLGSWDDAATPMVRGDDGVWRATIDLPDGRSTYRFRLPSRSSFMGGQVVEIADPRSRLVEKGDGGRSVVVVADGEDVTTAPTFAWEHDAEPLPANGELVIYELHVGEFGHDGQRPGTFRTLIDRLGYLRDLGVNAIELMPVSTAASDAGWGYDVRFPFAVEPAFGSPEDFKRLVDACHVSGIRVMLDVVLNQSDTEAPLTRIDFDYFYRETRPGEPSFGPPFDYDLRDESLDSRPLWDFALDTVSFWVREYHIDGLRLDATAMIANLELIRAVRDRAREAAGERPFIVIAEEIPEDPTIAGADGPADSAWHQALMAALDSWLTGQGDATPGDIATALNPATSAYAVPELVVNFVESHDEETLNRQLADHEITGAAALRRLKLAGTLLLTAVGLPMLYQGQEFGGSRKREMGVRPLQWESLDQDFGRALHQHYATLIELRHGSPAITGRDFEAVDQDDDNAALVYRRGIGEAEVLVAVNLWDEDRALSVPFPDGAWRSLLDGAEWDVTGGRLEGDFAASEANVFVRR